MNWKNFWKSSFLLIFISLQISNSFSQKKDFKVFDAIMIESKPNLFKHGLSKINMIYEDSLLKKNPKYPKDFNQRLVDNSKVLRSYQRINPNYPICLDVESWLFNNASLKASVKKYSSLLNKFKANFPKTELGYYGVLPYADLNIYQAKATFLKSNSKKDWLGEWNNINNNLSDIAAVSTVAYPSCYTRFKDRALWLTAFKMQVEKIKKIDPSLKIYAFIWPQYYSPGFGYNNEYIEGDFWRFQLEEIYKLCDGVVIWHSPFNSPSREKITWNGSRKWWLETLSFIKAKGIKSNYNGN